MSEKRVSERPETKDLVAEYYKASVVAGHWLSQKEVNAHSLLPNTYTACWIRAGRIKGIRRMAMEQCGELKNAEKNAYIPRVFYSDEELLRRYFQESEKAGHWLTTKEVEALKSLPDMKAYYQRIGRIEDVKVKAFQLCVTKEHRLTELPTPETIAERREKVMRKYHEQSKANGAWLSGRESFERGIFTGKRTMDQCFSGMRALRKTVIEKYGDINVKIEETN